MRILMVTPYAPLRDGLAAYAVQQVKALRAEGHDVRVLSPGPSAAHEHLDLRGPRGVAALTKRVRSYDRVIVQFHPDVFYPYPSSPSTHASVSVALAGCFRMCRSVEVVLHEADYERGRRKNLDGFAARALWRIPDRLIVHTETERELFCEAYGFPLERVTVADHGASFVRRAASDDQADARRRLGLPVEGHRFLSIGFLQPHKGFDRAVRAFAGLDAVGCHLDVVGSVRVEEPEFLAHRDGLRALCAVVPGATLHDGYVSDEAFDTWIVAADTVVLPYRMIWSSGVMERARLYDRPVIASRVGGLADQAPPGTVLVDDDEELAAALRARVGLTGAEAPPRGAIGERWAAPLGETEAEEPWPVGEPGFAVDREAIQATVRRRAARHRSSSFADGGPDALAAAGIGPHAEPARRAEALRRLPPLGLPAPVSARPGASAAKRLLRRLTAWQLDPLVAQLNALREAAVADLERPGP